MYCYPMLYPPSHHREEDRRRHAFGKVSRPVHDRLGPHRSGQRRQPAPVRPVAIDRSDRSHRRPVKVRSPRQVYRVKKKKDEVHTTVDPEKAKADDKVQICNIKVDVSVASTRPMVFDIFKPSEVIRSRLISALPNRRQIRQFSFIVPIIKTIMKLTFQLIPRLNRIRGQ